MSPSVKKTTGVKKPASSPPARTSKAGGGRSQSCPAKTAPKKRASGSRRSKKGAREFRIPLLTAFLAGLLMAGVCFWGINRVTEMRAPASVPPVTANNSPFLRTDGPLPRIDKDASPSGEIISPAKRGVLPSALDPKNAVTEALLDLQSLPFEESLAAPLEEHIRHVDYALMQAAWLCKLPSKSMRLAGIEDHIRQGEPYHVQILEILPGKTPDVYRHALSDTLEIWTEGVLLRVLSKTRWVISINGTDTHILTLYPGHDAFPAAPPAQDQIPWSSPQRVRPMGAPARMVIVMDDLGMSLGPVKKLLELPYPVTMAFWPHSPNARDGAEAAHKAGREVLVHQPMEPLGYPRVKPGPGVLLVGMQPDTVAAELKKSFARVPHAVGLNNHMGSRFTQNREGTRAVTRALTERGMLILDSVTHSRSVLFHEGRKAGIPHFKRNVFLDNTASKTAVLAALSQAERIALLTGVSIAIGHPHAETLAALKEWGGERNRKVSLVRLSDLARQ